ncbi:uncharacterized protein ARMOST_16737 [Armillaria ostoyae]|uniref:Uncharacterized protein n=1 Tax=Armillaria ostoyae TaxID=47428 RepID=A0A284RX21_ARMOS|nr:uncharacterized protein ARMOST_16737 [Armillaria ostoyae]
MRLNELIILNLNITLVRHRRPAQRPDPPTLSMILVLGLLAHHICHHRAYHLILNTQARVPMRLPRVEYHERRAAQAPERNRPRLLCTLRPLVVLQLPDLRVLGVLEHGLVDDEVPNLVDEPVRDGTVLRFGEGGGGGVEVGRGSHEPRR